MRIIAALLVALLPLPAFPDCPPAPDITAEAVPILDRLRTAPDPATAQVLTHAMWQLWTRAPDARAQDLLDSGMERREAYDLTKADALLTELVEYCPDYAEGWNQRAFVRFLDAQYALALEDLEVAVSLSPDHFAALAGQALTLMNLGRVEAGQSILRQALALNPWLPERGMLLPEKPGQEL